MEETKNIKEINAEEKGKPIPHLVVNEDDKSWFENNFPDFGTQREMMHEIRKTLERNVALEGIQKQRQNIETISGFLNAIQETVQKMGIDFDHQEALIRSEYQSKIDTLSLSLQEKEEEITELKETAVSLKEEKKQLTEELNECRKELSECLERISDLRASISSQESNTKLLHENLESLKNAASAAVKEKAAAEDLLSKQTDAYNVLLKKEKHTSEETAALKKQLSDEQASAKKELSYITNEHASEIDTLKKQAAAEMKAAVSDAIQKERDIARTREIDYFEKIERLQAMLSEKDALISKKTTAIESLELRLKEKE